MMLLENTPAVLSQGKLCEEFCVQLSWDEWPETTSHQKRQENSLRLIESCTIRRTWFIHEVFYLINFSCIFIAGNCDRHGNSRTKRSDKASEDSSARGNFWHESTEIENPNDDEELQSGELQGVPDWLQEFQHGLVDESVPEHRDASSSSNELPLEPRAKVVPSKHNIFNHFPKDGNCDVYLRTKITRAPCRRRTGTVVPRVENFGDLIAADHKILSEGCESRHYHRYAVVEQDWLLSGYNLTLVKRKLLRKHKRACKSSWSQIGSLKSFTLTILWNLARLVKN